MNWENSGLGEELESQNRRVRKHDLIMKYAIMENHINYIINISSFCN